jgi:hypothetical protein
MIKSINEIVPPNLSTKSLIADVQAFEPYGSKALNRQMRGILKKGIYSGFDVKPATALNVRVSSTGVDSAASVEVGTSWLINVRQQFDIDVAVPAGRISSIVMTAFYDGVTLTDQVDADSAVKAVSISAVNAGSEPANSLILCQVNVPSNATSLTQAMISYDKRDRVSLEGFFNKLDEDHIAPKGQWLRTILNRGIKPSLDNVRAAAVDTIGTTDSWFKEVWAYSYRGGSINVEGAITSGGTPVVLKGDFGVGGTSILLADNTDLNALPAENGDYRGIKLLNTPDGATVSNRWWHITHKAHSTQNSIQIAFQYQSAGASNVPMHTRTRSNGVWTAWEQSYTTSFKPNKTDVGLSALANERQYSAQNNNIGAAATNYAAGNHDHDTAYAAKSHTHPWADVIGAPVFTSRWPTWSEVSSKPATMPPSAHTHPWAEVTGAPIYTTRWPAWDEVTGKPATMAPSSHTHPWAQVTGAPIYTTRWPAWGEVSGKPDTYEFGRTLAVGDDLNNLLTTGWYDNQADSNATVVKNYPITQAGKLEVHSQGAMVYQRYTSYSTSIVHLRTRYNGVWKTWAEQYSVNNKPTYADVGAAAASHTHPWSQVTGAPVYTTRWPAWDEVTGKPSTMAPSSHTHDWAQITGEPIYTTRWPAWDEVTGKPSTMAPSSHSHPWSQVTGAPVYTTRWPTVAEVGALAAGGTAVNANAIGGVEAQYIPRNDTNRVSNPEGAYSTGTAATVTGAIKITLPQSWTSTMMRMRIKIYLYGDDQAFDIIVGGYNYSTSSAWANCSAFAGGDMPSALDGLKIRFGHDGSKCCIWIGEVNSSWSYPQVYVTDFEYGFSDTTASRWNNGWNVGFVTSFTTKVDITKTVHKPYSTNNKPSHSDIGAAAASHTHPWAQVTGAPIYTTRWPTWSEVSNTPTTMPPSAHTHPWAEVTGAPIYTTRWPTWSEVSSKPTTMPPSAHTHPWAEVTGTPVYTTRWPTSSEVGLGNVPNTVHSSSSAINTVAVRDGSGDIAVRSVRSEYADSTTITGSIGFRVNNSTDNYMRFCNSPTAVRGWLGAAASSHTHSWAEVTGAPIYTTRWPTWDEVTGKPATMAPSSHTHDWAQVTGAPVYTTRWPTWTEVSSKPTTMPPSAHTHAWAEVTGAPVYTTRWPSWGEVSGKPSTMAPDAHTHGGWDVRTLGSYLNVTSDGKLVANNTGVRRVGMYGIYDAAKIGHIWSMGEAYVIDQAGANFGTLYGAAYYHPNNGKGAYAGGHQFIWVQNGGPTVALGDNIWTSGAVFEYGAALNTRYAAISHTHPWAQVTGVPVYTTRWPNSSEVGLGNVPNTVHSSAADINTVAVRDSAADINARLFRSNYGNESTVAGAMAFRNSTTDNYIRFCSNPAAIRSWLGAAADSHTHSWAQVTGAPVYTTRWPTWSEVSSKPTTMPPSAHTHPTKKAYTALYTTILANGTIVLTQSYLNFDGLLFLMANDGDTYNFTRDMDVFELELIYNRGKEFPLVGVDGYRWWATISADRRTFLQGSENTKVIAIYGYTYTTA